MKPNLYQEKGNGTQGGGTVTEKGVDSKLV